MANWENIEIEINGESVKAQAPVIISASRSTDIPAFYSDWFFHRLKIGFSSWTNPFNGVKMHVSYAKTRFIVFWSKNPYPLLKHLDELKSMGIKCYIHFSLNDYEEEGLEKNVPPLKHRIKTFKLLVSKLGKGSVIWRFDPLILTDRINIDKLIDKIDNIGDQLFGYTEKLVFSFVDISSYKRVKTNLQSNGVNYEDWTDAKMKEFTSRLVALNKHKRWNYELATCGEEGRYEGVIPNHCIDYSLIVKLAHEDKELMKYIGANIKNRASNLFGEQEELPANAIELPDGRYVIRDKGQRTACGCMNSKDIGQYNTCIHECEYCYANTNKATARLNYECHIRNPLAETINGK